MSVLSDSYKRIMSEVEAKITDQNELEFVKLKMNELSMIFMEVIDNLSNETNQKIKRLEEKQQKIEDKMLEVENYVNDIENDMLDEMEEIIVDEEYDDGFEITCPYCNKDFYADINGKNEIDCPECKNIIELDWNDEEEQQSCGCANGGCNSCPGCNVDLKRNQENKDNEKGK
ncbi:MAG: hypothetical protein J6M60_07560 [Clostridia bacterium]|nr:hypothetical protein [Clostridia bacterium]